MRVIEPLLLFAICTFFHVGVSLDNNKHGLIKKQVAFINELHYNNFGPDIREFIEVAFPTGTDVSSYYLILYRGRNGRSYATLPLVTATRGSDSNGLSFYYVETQRIRDGTRTGDGIALVNPEGKALQFLSYGGAFKAVGGPVKGRTSVDIGVNENADTAVGYSLQLGGTGCVYDDFSWQPNPVNDTRGTVNSGQSISCSQTDTTSNANTTGFLEFVGIAAKDRSIRPLGPCKGDCNKDSHCALGLACYKRRWSEPAPPGCNGRPAAGHDYCYKPKPGEGILVQVVAKNGNPLDSFPLGLGMCRGHCSDHSDCGPGLSCFFRSGTEAVPGCRSVGYPQGVWNTNYCIDSSLILQPPLELSLGPTISPTSPAASFPTASPTVTKQTQDITSSPTASPITVASRLERPTLGYPKPLKLDVCTSDRPCDRCEGDCFNDDTKCRADLGLVCYSRTNSQPVAGCVNGGPGDVSGAHYCYEPPKDGPITYVPGDLTVYENGLVLSTGLTSRIIAEQRKKVRFEGPGRGRSSIVFHLDPDGAAVFEDPTTGGFRYVSNAESTAAGTVGALIFNAKAQVVGYERLIERNITRRNCGGGKTFWNTWLSCEETDGGQVWEVDPFGIMPPRKTLIGGLAGDWFESAAYDNRDPINVKFYITADREAGPVHRFSPDKLAIARANVSGNYTDLLHTNETGTAGVDYLVLEPDPFEPDNGRFRWTDNMAIAEASAREYYKNPEGIDIRNGFVYFTCKGNQKLFILDLDSGVYESSSTESGAFDKKPDQVARLSSGDDSILYFCEENKWGANGVHGRDSLGNYYTVIDGLNYTGDSTGLAFSPDNRHMYVSYQKPGFIFDITRTDGYPFDGQRLDIKYHHPDAVYHPE